MLMGVRRRAYAVDWSYLARWDLKSARAAAFRMAHPTFQPLGRFVEEATEIVHAAREPEHEWPVYGVNNREGVVFSHRQKGAAFNAPYKRIKQDWFFHNPTRANVGSLGRVGSVPDDALTSPEYQVWRIKQGLLPEFLEILIRLPFFLDLIECHRVGAVKERLFVENLCEIPIPVLGETAQRRVVECWQQAQAAIAEAEARVEKRRAAVDAQFFADLGLKSPAEIVPPKAFAVWWEDFLRWGVNYNQQVQAGADITRGHYSIVALGSLLELVQYGTSAKANKSGEGVAVIRMNNIVDGQLDLSDLKHVPLEDPEVAALQLKDGDILFNRTNSKELVGKCAVFHEAAPYVFASYIIRLRTRASDADPDYVSFVINSSIGRQQIDALSRQIIGQANVNTEELRGLQLPLPPLPEQRRIMERVAAARAEIAREREAAHRRATEATAEVEALILGSKASQPADIETGT